MEGQDNPPQADANPDPVPAPNAPAPNSPPPPGPNNPNPNPEDNQKEEEEEAQPPRMADAVQGGQMATIAIFSGHAGLDVATYAEAL